MEKKNKPERSLVNPRFFQGQWLLVYHILQYYFYTLTVKSTMWEPLHFKQSIHVYRGQQSLFTQQHSISICEHHRFSPCWKLQVIRATAAALMFKIRVQRWYKWEYLEWNVLFTPYWIGSFLDKELPVLLSYSMKQTTKIHDPQGLAYIRVMIWIVRDPMCLNTWPIGSVIIRKCSIVGVGAA